MWDFVFIAYSGLCICTGALYLTQWRGFETKAHSNLGTNMMINKVSRYLSNSQPA